MVVFSLKIMRTILLFGTFDGIHEGHRSCFSQAKQLADHLVIAVAPDSIVMELKGHPTKATAEERALRLQAEPLVDEVVVGDRQLGSYGVLFTIKPDLVAVGYDQYELAEHLRTWARSWMSGLPIIRLKPFEPETYKTSRLV